MKLPIKIIFISKFNAKYGAQNHVYSYLNFLRKSGENLSKTYLVSFSSTVYDVSMFEESGMNYVNLRTFKGIAWICKGLRYFREPIRLESHSALAGYISGILAVVFDSISHVHHIHGSFLNKFKRNLRDRILRSVFQEIEKIIWSKSRLMFCSSDDMEMYESIGFSKNRMLRFKYHIRDHGHVDSGKYLSQGPLHFIFVGGFRNQKNQKALVQAVLHSNNVDNDAVFHFFGDGPNRLELEKMVLESGIDKFVFHGFCEHEEIVNFIFANKCIGILLSYYEGQPLSLIEHLSFGLPVIANNFSGTKELFRDNIGTLLPLEFDSKDLDTVLKEYSNLKPSTLKEMSESSRRTYLNNFNYDETIINYSRKLSF